MTDVRQLTFAGRRSGEGYFSKNGARLVFQSEREPGNPFYQIYLMDLRTGDVGRASPGVGKTTCGWIHPSGGQLLFASTHLDPESEALQKRELASRELGEGKRYAWDYDPHYDLFSVKVPLGDDAPRRLTHAPGYDAEASWSPDGRFIAFTSNRHVYDAEGNLSSDLSEADRKRAANDLGYFMDLYIMDARGQNVRRLTDVPGYDGGAFFSPDGKHLVFRRFSEDGVHAEIHTIRTDGTDERKLTRLHDMSWAPFYHPSGDYVIFTTNREGFSNFELYIVDSEGASRPVRVTNLEGFDGLPAFSPDGEKLLWTRKPPSGRSQIYAARWNDALARAQLRLPSQTFHAVGPLLPVPADLNANIEPEDLRTFVAALTSKPANGRLAGTPGERIATGYVARVFRSLGLEPAGDGGYFQEFGFTAGVSLGDDNRLTVTGVSALDHAAPGGRFTVDRDWRPLAFSKTGEVPPSAVVFAGYGIVAPEAPGVEAVDDYAHLDVEGKWVLVFRYVPEKLAPEARRHLKRHASLRYKAMTARNRGARGILFVSGPNSRVRKELVELRSDASLAGTSIAVLSLGDTAAEALVASGSEHTLADLQSTLDNQIAMPGFTLAGVTLEANVDIRQQRKKARNVIARLPAATPPERGADGRIARRPVVLIGAHVDHLGTGEGAGSLARDDERSEVHPGADDNASGVAALLEMAGALAHLRQRGELDSVRDIVFAAWSGEELGLLGSSAWVERELRQALTGSEPASDGEPAANEDLSSRVAAYLNLDMVGRLEDEVLLFGVDSSPVWPNEIEERNVPIGLAVRPLGNSFLPTDATSFYVKGVPVLAAFTGAHEEYHTPRDTAEHLDYAGLAKIAQLLADISASLASQQETPRFTAATSPPHGMPRAGLRVYLGTIPNYANETTMGLALSGVSPGGPADKAGLRAGDVVTQVGENEIENIYDYTYALDALEIGVAVEVVVQRGGETRRFMLTPASRD